MVKENRIKPIRQLIEIKIEMWNYTEEYKRQKHEWKQCRHKNKRVMVRKEQKTQSARMASKHKPLPSLSLSLEQSTGSPLHKGQLSVSASPLLAHMFS